MLVERIQNVIERFGVLRAVLVTGSALGFGLGLTCGMAVGRWFK